MTEPKRFKRGRRTYTKWGPNFKEVRVQGSTPPEGSLPPPSTSVTIDLDPVTELGVYSNMSALFLSGEEVILDFVFLPPGQSRGRIRSRVVLPFPHVHRLADVLKKTSEDIKRREKKKE
ncbi:MAG: DUF3467 domain-containing protein [Elusimicrobia bacterium]|nr:DUF3467 domain-containing protein [Candidatus Obscuribacterium magneticum]